MPSTPRPAQAGEPPYGLDDLFVLKTIGHIRQVRLLICCGFLFVIAVVGGMAVAGWRDLPSLFVVAILLAFAVSGMALLAASQVGAKLSRQKFQLCVALNRMSHGLCMFDSAGRLVMCNERYLRMCGLSRQSLRVGCTLYDVMEQRAAADTFSGNVQKYVAHTLQEMAQGNPIDKVVERGGRTIAISNRPLPGGGWISTHEDITAQRQTERTIQEAHANLLDVIEAMPAGLVMYDNEDRLVLWNRRYDSIYPQTAELRTSGVRFEEMLRAGVARGMYAEAAGREEEWIRERLARRHGSYEIHEQGMADGRWVRVEDYKTRLGGYIGIRVDITELKQREECLRLQNVKLDAALQNMSQGLVMFGADGKLVFCNRQYAELYRLPPELMKPGMTQDEILECRIARGIIPKEAIEQYIKDRREKAASGVVSNTTLELSDGRVLSVIVRPTPSGGWVTTHEDITERRRAEAVIARMAHYDPLTGLANRARFGEELDRALARAREGAFLALLFLDLDHFKRANDTLGHLVGDELLKSVADRLRKCVGKTDFIARLGGDEFAVLQTSVAQRSDSAALATRISEGLKEPFYLNEHKVVIGVSIGISTAPIDAVECEQLLKNADLALYTAKGCGRGTYCFYEPELNTRSQARQQLESELREAFVNGEFDLSYQPIVNLRNNRINRCEAILSWRHPQHGLLAQSELMQIAEGSGLIKPLGEWVLRRACADAAAWPDDLKVAVNLSPGQLSGGKLLQIVINTLSASDISARKLELEITESALTRNTFAALAALHQLHEIGVRIVLDDFGAGHSSLSLLRSFPFDGIKIDRSFIDDLLIKDDAVAIVRALTGMARQLGISTTAEGIETEEQRRKVRELGCTEMQGRLFSPPRRADEILRMFPRDGARIVRNFRKAKAG